ncbi:MAG: class I SAM-dependent methyltransferase [Rhodospirillales bacterium]|nr:class I SAM-dependent methyltransferase [Rhodospirillales bacterium]
MNDKTSSSKYFDILSAKAAYAEGKNVTQFLRKQMKTEENTAEIIETAYDLQAGTYIQYANENIDFIDKYSSEAAKIIEENVESIDSILDIGTGELTTLTSIIGHMHSPPERIYAFDISWSRIFKGITYAHEHAGPLYSRFVPFVADIAEIPMPENAVNTVISSHALEPNGGKLEILMSELFRVAHDKLILFEPCYEINSPEGKKRMEDLGYIRGIDDTIETLGGTLIEKIEMKTISNPLNPTVCFIIKPPKSNYDNVQITNTSFSAPGTNFPLTKIDDFYFSQHTGLSFPVIKSVPILRSNAAILTSSLSIEEL